MLEFVHHVAYAVDDMDRAVAIFRDMFELELLDRRMSTGTSRRRIPQAVLAAASGDRKMARKKPINNRFVPEEDIIILLYYFWALWIAIVPAMRRTKDTVENPVVSNFSASFSASLYLPAKTRSLICPKYL